MIESIKNSTNQIQDLIQVTQSKVTQIKSIMSWATAETSIKIRETTCNAHLLQRNVILQLKVCEDHYMVWRWYCCNGWWRAVVLKASTSNNIIYPSHQIARIDSPLLVVWHLEQTGRTYLPRPPTRWVQTATESQQTPAGNQKEKNHIIKNVRDLAGKFIAYLEGR